MFFMCGQPWPCQQNYFANLRSHCNFRGDSHCRSVAGSLRPLFWLGQIFSNTKKGLPRRFLLRCRIPDCKRRASMVRQAGLAMRCKGQVSVTGIGLLSPGAHRVGRRQRAWARSLAGIQRDDCGVGGLAHGARRQCTMKWYLRLSLAAPAGGEARASEKSGVLRGQSQNGRARLAAHAS